MKRSFISSVSKGMKVLVLGMLIMLAVVRVNGQAVVTATGAGPGPVSYTTLRLAFAAINAGTHTGAITITIGAAGTNETGGVAILNENAAPASYTSVLIKPAATTSPTITGNIANDGLIHLFGATNVTIDGSNTVGGTTKNLTIRNGTGTAGSSVIRFGHNATTGASNNTVKNCLINMAGPTIGIAITSGAGAGTLTFVAGTIANSNNTIQNNTITSCQTAFYTYGPAATDNNWLITQNDMNNLAFAGVTIYNTTNAVISDNIINNVTINGATQVAGITVSWATNSMVIRGNKITNISNTFGVAAPNPQAEGIFLTISAGSVSVYNNFIANVTGVGNASIATNGHGILHNNAGTMSIYHNTIKMTTDQGSAAGTPAAICFGPGVTGTTNLRDNIFVNSQTVGNRYAIYSSVAPAAFSGIDYNDYFATSGNHGFIGGIPRTTLAAIQAGFGSNLNSITPLNPVFISTTDLHLQTVAANLPLAAGTPIAVPAITTDIDGALRSTTTPTIGAHEMINKITYTNMANSCRDDFDTLFGVYIESPVGVPFGGAFVPRLYFRKGAGPWSSVAGYLAPAPASIATASYWRFPIDYSLLGGVVSGDVISYYVVAQTTGGTVFSNPLAGFTAVDVNTITTPPTTPNTYTIQAVSLVGFVTANQTCFDPTIPQYLPYSYTGTTGSPNQYTLTWSPVGPPPVPVFAALPPAVITGTVSPGLPAAPYNGIVTIKNSTTGCQKTYNISMMVNPLPGLISGATTMCAGTGVILSSSSTGGTWSSSNLAVATVGITTGVVNGLTGGTSTISYTLPTGCKTFAVVSVVTPPGPITGTPTTCPGLTTALSNSIAGGTWASSNPTVGTVDPVTGIFTGLNPGTTLVTYAISGCSPASRLITVNATPNPITGTLYACEGFTTTLSTTSTGGTWISGTPSVATIGSTTGLVSGISGGVSAITYKFTTTGCIITNTVTIYPAPGVITGGPLVCQGLSVTLGNSIPGGTWTSSLPGVISVGLSTGIATGIASSGTVTISYILPTGCRRSTVLGVSTPPTSIAGSQVLCSEYTVTLTNGTGGGTWSSSNPAVATVGSTTGVVSGIVGGTATISYVTTVCNPVVYAITVNQTPPPITGGITLCNGGSTTSLFNSTPGGVWTISGSAFISPTGVVTGLTVGASNVVTYTVPNGCYRTAPIIVDTLPAPIYGVDTICPGRSATFTTASTGGLWSSNNAVIASVVAASGVVTGVSFGTTTITYAALSGCYRTKPLNVTNPLPLSVTLTRTPAQDTLCMGSTVTFTAHPTNGGIAPDYEWQLFGVSLGAPTVDDSTHTYIPTHGDVIRVFLYNSLDVCSAPTPAYVDMPINVYPNVTPTISMTTGTATTIISGKETATMTYLGQTVTFNTLVTSGGPNPSYQWYADGDPVPGATDNTYTRAVYDDDEIFCRVNGNPPCETGSLATSNTIYLRADYLQTTTVEGLTGSLSLFPNPNTGSFTLTGTTGSSLNEHLKVEVVNVLGQVVFNGTTIAKGGAINYQVKLGKDISAGTYMLRVSGATVNNVFHFVVGD
jgi:uncharacterized protein YjdB